MVTQTPNQLSHEEAFELLPWHVNATLDESLSEQVADHVDGCPSCQDETAILSNTVLALNSDQAVGANIDGQFSRLLVRVREHEHSERRARQQDGRSLAQRISDWLGMTQPRLQWAGAFALGLAVGIGALLAILQSDNINPGAVSPYETHSSDSAPVQLSVQFARPPGVEMLAELELATGATANWQPQSATEYLIEFTDATTVKTVADIKSQLLSHEAVVMVDIHINNTEIESD